MTLFKFNSESEWLEARKHDVTSTEVSALMGMSEYKSRLKLWMIKAGKIEDDFVETGPTKWGRRLQNAIGQGISEDEGWTCFDLSNYYLRDDEARVGASMDFKVVCPAGTTGLLETKSTGFFDTESGWIGDRAPIDYEFQIQTQINLANAEGHGVTWGAIGALDGRKNSKVLRRTPDTALFAMIRAESLKFWHSIAINEPPAPDYAADGELIRMIQGKINVGQNVSLTGNNRAHELIEAYIALEAAREQVIPMFKNGEARINAIKNELHHMAGKAETVLIGDYRINCSETVIDDRLQKGYKYRRFDLVKIKRKNK